MNTDPNGNNFAIPSYFDGNFSYPYTFSSPASAYVQDNAYGFNYAFTASGVPELGTWAMMIIGFGGVGLQLRRRTGGMATTA